jgi:hypothetical protein
MQSVRLPERFTCETAYRKVTSSVPFNVNGSPDFVVLQSLLPERILQYPFGGEFLRSLLKQSSRLFNFTNLIVIFYSRLFILSTFEPIEKINNF